MSAPDAGGERLADRVDTRLRSIVSLVQKLDGTWRAAMVRLRLRDRGVGTDEAVHAKLAEMMTLAAAASAELELLRRMFGEEP